MLAVHAAAARLEHLAGYDRVGGVLRVEHQDHRVRGRHRVARERARIGVVGRRRVPADRFAVERARERPVALVEINDDVAHGGRAYGAT